MGILEEASNQISHTLTLEGMVCGLGETCPMSALPWIFSEDTKITPDKFCKMEDQTEIWEQAKTLGQQMGDRLRK